MDSTNFYPSKILLVGEYTILSGNAGLAIPFIKKFAHWKKESSSEHEILKDLILYISENPTLSKYINLSEFRIEIDNGLYLESSIPYGYGLGSSGTLCAAILDRFGINLPLQVAEIFSLLKELEHFFHGQSSGVDPAVAYFKKPIYIENNQIQILSLNTADFIENHHINLLDSKLGRNTEALVEVFKEKLKSESFKHSLIQELVPANKNLINAILHNQADAISSSWEQVSRKSFTLFEELIPETIKSYWEEGMRTGAYYCKLCGAGGGGYFLVKETKEADKLFREEGK
ncbi:MAG: hypothetical protein V9E90_15230 [Saprospiraceae bacterium]